jgi:hypothetical protein
MRLSGRLGGLFRGRHPYVEAPLPSYLRDGVRECADGLEECREGRGAEDGVCERLGE